MSLAALVTPTTSAECLDTVVMLPRIGVGTVHMEIPGDSVPLVGERAVLTIASEEPGAAVTFAGVIRRREPWQARTKVVMVIGAGGLRAALPPRDDIGGPSTVTALLVAQGIAAAAGETLDSTVAANLAGLGFASWRRAGADALGVGGSGAEALDALVAKLVTMTGRTRFAWRTLPSGALWIGEDTFATSAADTGEVLIDDGDDGRIDCAPPAAALLPGTTINGRAAERVTYRIMPGATRAEVLYSVAGDLAARRTPEVYQQPHGGIVRSQQADGSIDVTVDDPRIGGARAVPFKLGLPGCKVTIPAGTRVRLAFADADPSQLFAYAIDPDVAAVASLALVGDETGTWVKLTPGDQLLTSSPPFAPDAIKLTGIIIGPGHKYVKGVSA